jgi:hypothetical protein
MSFLPEPHESDAEPAVTLRRMADRVASMIVTSCYSDLDCLLPQRMELYDRIYTARFRRLRAQFR